MIDDYYTSTVDGARGFEEYHNTGIPMMERDDVSKCDRCNGNSTSDCCGAEIVLSDICDECKEHCSNQCESCEDEE
jgi:hypothetical protein